MSSRTKVLRWLIVLGSFVCLIYIVSANRQELESISQVNPYPILGMVFSYAIYLFVASHRFLIVLRQFGIREISWFEWLKIYIIGRFISKWIPQSGNIYRGIELKSSYKLAYSDFVSSCLSFQWIDTVLALLMAFIVILVRKRSHALDNTEAILLILASSLVLLIVAPFFLTLTQRIVKFRIKFVKKVQELGKSILDSIQNKMQDLRFVAKVVLLGVVSFLITLASFYFAFLSLGIYDGLSDLFLFTCLLRLTAIYNLSPGNLGIQELLCGLLGEVIDIGFTFSVLFSILVRFVSYSVLGGLVIVLSFISILRLRKENEIKR